MDTNELLDIAEKLRELAARLEALGAEPAPAPATEPVEQPPLRQSITLSINDRYRFQRELFGGSAEAMNNALDEIASLNSAIEVERYLAANDFDLNDDTVKNFLRVTTRRFELRPPLLA